MEANASTTAAYREMEEAMKAAQDRDAMSQLASTAQAEAQRERKEAESAKAEYESAGGKHRIMTLQTEFESEINQEIKIEGIGEEEDVEEGSLQMKRRLGAFSNKTAMARLALRRAASKVAMESTLIDKMTGATVIIPPKNIKWARGLFTELIEAKLKSDNAFLVQIRGCQPHDPSTPGSMFLANEKPTTEEVAFWRPPEHPGLSRLPEYLYEFLQDKFGHGRTTERRLSELMANPNPNPNPNPNWRRLSELMATIATHAKGCPDVTIIMRFIADT